MYLRYTKRGFILEVQLRNAVGYLVNGHKITDIVTKDSLSHVIKPEDTIEYKNLLCVICVILRIVYEARVFFCHVVISIKVDIQISPNYEPRYFIGVQMRYC